MTRALHFMALFATVVALVVLPYAAFAQDNSSELKATIRNALLSDPRTSSMSEAQISAMIDLLAGEAQKQGITARDITWQPETEPTAADAAAVPAGCGAVPRFFCNLNHAFGFDGSDWSIPTGLAVTSGLLIVILGIMIERHFVHIHAMRQSVPMK